jgi:hypothetical protein
MGCGSSNTAAGASAPTDAPVVPAPEAAATEARAPVTESSEKWCEKGEEAAAMEMVRAKKRANSVLREKVQLANKAAQDEYEAERQSRSDNLKEATNKAVLTQLATYLPDEEMEKGKNEERQARLSRVMKNLKHRRLMPKFRVALEAKDMETAKNVAALMMQTVFHTMKFRADMAEKEAQIFVLMQSASARKLQRLFRLRQARKLVAKTKEEIEEMEEEEEMRMFVQGGNSYISALHEEEITLTTGPPAVMKGFVKKEGQMRHSTKRRFFVLRTVSDTESVLKYYTDELDTEPFGIDEKGSISLAGASLGQQQGMTMVLTSADKRDLKMTFNNLGDISGWKHAFQEHITYSSK